MSKPLLIEIGFEELPAIPLLGELPNISTKFHNSLKSKGFLAKFDFFYTPRRFVFFSTDVAENGIDEEVEFFGPPLTVAYKDTVPTKAYESFLVKNSLTADDVKTIQKDGKECLYAKKLKKGDSLEASIGLVLQEFLDSLVFGKTMLWASRSDGFIRPIRWLVTLYGSDILQAEVFGVSSKNETYGHRQYSFDAIRFDDFATYFRVIKDAGVEINQDLRRERVLAEIGEIENKNGIVIEIDHDLLAEVVAITENPKALLGSFDAEFLQVAPEIIITSMRENQRYFPVFKDGKLFNGFVVVSNAVSDDFTRVVKGNERVLRARLSDALFFWKNDLARRLNPDPLKNIVFVNGAGSVYDKCMREADIAVELGNLWGIKNIEDLKTAMHLSKADLVTDAVGEFGELQGVIGKYYAKNDGYSDEIATAIMEHYLPKGEDSELPSSIFSATAAIASKLDSIMALFSLGMIPSGSKDPFALRRAGFGIVRIVIEFNLNFNIAQVVSRFKSFYREFDSLKVESFLVDRVYQLFSEVNPSIITAVIASGERDILAIAEKVEALSILSRRDGFRENFSTFKRVANISKDFDLNSVGSVDESLFENEYENELFIEFKNAIGNQGSYYDELHALFGLKIKLDSFFDNCMVNADDPKIRENRKNLVSTIYVAFRKIADIKEIAF